MHKSGSGLLKIPKAESAGHMFFSHGMTINYDRILWLKSEVRQVLFVPLVASYKNSSNPPHAFHTYDSNIIC